MVKIISSDAYNMPLAVEKIDISKLLGRCYIPTRMKPNKYNKSLESEFNTTTTTTTTTNY